MNAPSTTKPPRKEHSVIIKAYLFIYNAVQVLGWSYILYQLIDYYLLQSSGFRAQITLWNYTRIAVIIFQNAAFVEILHASLGFVKSNPVITAFQVFSRIIVVVGVIMATPTAKLSPGVSGELLCFWWAQSYAKSTSVWSMELPNKYNVTFSYYICLWIVMLSYLPLFPKLYMHMMAQRRKVLSLDVNRLGSSDKKKI
uniref:Very-long-chain (3R)-3-hydroxyacyl-CoA dehydratase n=1 Tax=Glossina morsitans morsitans TaxID=37546 RepID=A0A1B0FI89_GLOMM